MFDFFGRIRRKAAESVLLGCSDAFQALAPDDTTPPTTLADLRALLAAAAEPKALAAAEEDAEPTTRRGRK